MFFTTCWNLRAESCMCFDFDKDLIYDVLKNTDRRTRGDDGVMSSTWQVTPDQVRLQQGNTCCSLTWSFTEHLDFIDC